MKSAKIIIGAGYGDEGKGLVTDFLSQNWADLTVRFNGGAQAGHTVNTSDGTTHIFSHFGSGSLHHIPTYLSQYFVVNPIMFKKEYESLERKLRIVPHVFIHEDCMVTTILDILVNQEIEKFRGRNRHGSVGIGINETITRHLDTEYKITVGMLNHDMSGAMDIINDIYDDYVVKRLVFLGMTEGEALSILDGIDKDRITEETYKNIEFLLDNAILVEKDDDFLGHYDNIVFEGAQGLLLDEFHPYFPYVTRSRTGIHNVYQLIKDYKDVNVEIYYVTRPYLTRHGAGPFPTEVIGNTNLVDFPFDVYDPTNKPHKFQGTLRLGYLDIDLLKKTIYDDLNHFKGYPDRLRLVITCMDQAWEDMSFQKDGKLIDIKSSDFGAYMKKFMGFPVLLNYSPVTPETMEEYK